MKILLKSVNIIDPKSPFHGKIQDILIENNTIEKIEHSITTISDKVVEGKNLHASIGWMDIKASFREPGEEWKETIESGINAAKKGGFTEVIVSSDTKIPIDNRTQVEFVLNRSKDKAIKLHTYGSLSHQMHGVDLAEIGDMYHAGALAFNDNKNYVNGGLLSRGLLYTKTFNTKVTITPYERSISPKGQMHEGEISTKMGLVGIPSLSEEIQILRDLEIAKYQDCGIHFHTISTKKSVDIIKKAKKEGVHVTCDIAAHQLYYTDYNVYQYDTNYKVLPPFREKEDIAALIEGLKDGTIDAICSDHSPQDIESKNLEFEYAEFGIIGLESMFGCIHSILKNHMSIAEIIDKITYSPRKIFNLEVPEIKIGAKANLTVFDPTEEWIFHEHDIKSLSKNTPFIGEKFIGKPIETIY